MPSVPDLSTELLNEFSLSVQSSYASLLRALTEATHPRHGEDMLPLAQRSLTELIDRWRAAQLLAMPADVVRSRFPLSQPATRDLIDGLLTLALYAAPEAASGWEGVHHRIQQLYSALETPTSSQPSAKFVDVA